MFIVKYIALKVQSICNSQADGLGQTGASERECVCVWGGGEIEIGKDGGACSQG